MKARTILIPLILCCLLFTLLRLNNHRKHHKPCPFCDDHPPMKWICETSAINAEFYCDQCKHSFVLDDPAFRLSHVTVALEHWWNPPVGDGVNWKNELLLLLP
jgi:hypothetical protein